MAHAFEQQPSQPELPERAPTVQEQEQRVDELFDRLKDFTYLPSRKELRDALAPFKTKWDTSYNEVRISKTYDPPSIEKKFFETYGSHVYEILTEEFVDALANHLAKTADALKAKREAPITIAEPGAGSGRLSFFLRQRLDRIRPGAVNVIATDNQSYQRFGQIRVSNDIPVEQLDVEETLKLNPDIVITSWMPKHSEWDRAFAEASSVKEYILIGEPAITGGWEGLVDDDLLVLDDEDDEEFQRDGLNKENANIDMFCAKISDREREDVLAWLERAAWFKQGFTVRPLVEAHAFQLSLGGDLIGQLTSKEGRNSSKIFSFSRIERDTDSEAEGSPEAPEGVSA